MRFFKDLSIRKQSLKYLDSFLLCASLAIVSTVVATNSRLRLAYPDFAPSNGRIGFDLMFIVLSVTFLTFPHRITKRWFYIQACLVVVTILILAQKYSKNIATYFGFPGMPHPGADWESIFNYSHCPQVSRVHTCDSYGRPWVYGNIWKVFAFFPSARAFLFVGYLAFVFGMIALLWAIYKTAPVSPAILVASPAVFMMAERLNSDAFLLGIVIVATLYISRLPSSPGRALSLLLTGVLAAAKPFFGVLFLRLQAIKTDLLLGPILVVASVIISFGGFKNMLDARRGTLYGMSSQFGADFIGAIFLPHGTFLRRLVLGVLVTFIAAIALVRNRTFLANHIRLSKVFLPYNLVLVSAAMYSLSYLSGSQVFYKEILGLLCAVWFFTSLTNGQNRIMRMTGMLAILGTLGIGGTFVRGLESAVAATVCLGFLINYLRIKFILIPGTIL